MGEGKRALRGILMTSSEEDLDCAIWRWFFRELTVWGSENFREFDWRTSRMPYKIFLSEILLRRTTGRAVSRVFNKLVNRYPTLNDLSRLESLSEDLRPMGLGNQRSTQIKSAAKFILEKFGGEIPSEVESLLLVPGIGKYSARAISCFAFDKPVSIVDSNVRRVVSRFIGRSGVTDEQLYAFLDHAIRGETSSRAFNYAILDLGALICKPRHELCAECPLRENCVHSRKQITKIQELRI